MTKKSSQNRPAIAEPIDYLIIGHLTADLTDSGVRLGGTAAFSGLTGHALGLNTGIVSAFSDDLDIQPLKPLWIKHIPSPNTATFKNISDGVHRTQYMYQTAVRVSREHCPEFSQPPGLVHLGPLTPEIDPEILSCYQDSLKCMTPQGWFRSVDDQFRVKHQLWENYEHHMSQADIAAISVDDVQGNEGIISKMAAAVPILAVTENFRGARVYWHNDARFIKAPEVKYVDDTGAGDIFAAAFFYRYAVTKDPWEAGRFAVHLASHSVTRQYLDSIPTKKEIESAKQELLNS